MGTALVTGASAGLGEEFAWQLARAGHDLVVVSRDEARLSALAEELRAQCGARVEVLRADLSDRDDVARVAARIDADDAPVGLLVNNAGFGLGKRFRESELEEQDRALEVMVRAVMALSHAAARAMVRRGRGAILNVSSMAALFAYGSYSAHKAWVETFTEALANDLTGTGVTATCVRPGLVRTEFQQRAGMELRAPDWAWLEPEAVVSTALAAVRRGQVIVTPSARYIAALSAVKLLPRSLVRRTSRARVRRDDPQ